MDSKDIVALVVPLFNAYFVELMVTLAVLVTYIVINRLWLPQLERGVLQGKFKEEAVDKVVRTARAAMALVAVLVLGLVWGIEFGRIFVFAGTTLTLLGVALFASWSILSNITSYFVLMMHPSFKRGTFVRVIDADNYAEGYIAQVSLFNTKLITDHREVIVYPNNLLISRPALINPRNKLGGVGKLPIHETQVDDPMA